MNRLPRSRSVGSVGSLDGFNESLKYSKLHKRHGARRLPSYALPLGVALLIATAFFVAQSLTTKLPSADTLTLPELNVPRQSRVALEEGSGGAEEGEEGCSGDKCALDGGGSSRRQGGGVQQPTRHGGGSGGTAVDTAALEEAVGEIQELLSTTAKQQQQQQQQQQRRGGTVSSSVLRQRSNAARRQQHQQQQQRLGEGRGERRQRPSSSVEEGLGVHATGGDSPLDSGSGSLVVQRRKHRRKSKYTASLKQDIDDLILEAAEVAKMHGIATEAGGDEDEAAAEQEDVSELEGVGADALMTGAERCSPSSCSPHGACVEGRCQCVVMYSGKRCGHAVFLSWPFVSESMQHFGAGYEGDLVLHKRTKHFELKVFHPPNEAAGVAKQAFTVVADADTLARLRPLLPAQDAVLKGAAYRSCAVVGSSGSLLMHSNGAAIDSHEAVFRFNAAPTAGYERHVGSRTTHRLTNLASWGFHEREGEAVLVHTSLPQTVEGLLWNGHQASPWNVLPLDPEFEDYMTRSFSFAPSQGLYGVVLALHVCRSVTLYGFGLSSQQGVLQRYYDPCEPLSNAGRVEPQWAVLASLATARLLGLAEPCTAECMVPGASGAALCRQCRDAVGLTVPPLPECTDALRQQLAAQQYQVPWLAGGGSGDGSSAGGSWPQAGQQAASGGAGSSGSDGGVQAGQQAGQQAAGGFAGGS